MIEVGAAYVTVWLPLKLKVPVHPSPFTPPVAVQEAPDEIFHVSFAGEPIGTDVGFAVKVTEMGLTPSNGTTNGTPFDATVRLPARSPLPDDAKATPIVQVPPACRDVPQSFA